jgi:protein TonB
MVRVSERNADRLKSAVGVASFHALLGYALITGLGIDVAASVTQALKVFDVAQPPPPPPIEIVPAAKESKAPEGAAAPANLKSKASPVVAPPPEVKLEAPPPVVAAPVPNVGNDRSLGAAPVPGPGTGAGGVGTGTGSGGSGDGTGSGGRASKARLLQGELSRADYPIEVKRAGLGGRVTVRIAVATDGHVSDCTVMGSSGNAELDETSCRLIKQRYVFEPARDAQGRPVAALVTESHVWWTRPRRRGLFGF